MALLMTIKIYRAAILALAIAISTTGFAASKIPPTSITLLAPDYVAYPLYVGEIRSIEPLFFNQGHDTLNNNYQPVTERGLLWSVTPNQGLTVSQYGVITAVTPGTYVIRVTSLAAPKVNATKIIKVVAAPDMIATPASATAVDPQFADMPSHDEFITPQKMVTHQSTNCQYNPESATTTVTQGNLTWQVKPFADTTQANQYVLLSNNAAGVYTRDQQQYLIGNRYLPTDSKGGTANLKLQPVGTAGVCIFLLNGATVVGNSQILLQTLAAEQKAELLNNQTKQYVLRRGYASGANLTDPAKGTWVPEVSDNDGLWTSMYGAALLYRYAVLKREGSADVAQARADALASLKAVLLLSNISGRTQIVDAKIRYLSNYLIRSSYNLYSPWFLKANSIYTVDNYNGSLADQLGFYGMDAFATFPYNTRKTQFTLTPCFNGFTPDECANTMLNWTTDTNAVPATRARYLPGFIARTTVIDGHEAYDQGDGLFIHRGADNQDQQQILAGFDKLYLDPKTPDPFNIKLGNAPLPTVLNDALVLDGEQYQAANVIYKADTSLDEVIGHLFIYKVAYDILDNDDEEEVALKQLIVSTVVGLAEHYASNGYTLTDATGQAPTWGNSTRNYFNLDGEMVDGSVTAMIPLMVFKEAYYMTHDPRWQNEYQFLATNSAWNLMTMVKNYWNRMLWLNGNIDIAPPVMHLDFAKNPTMQEQVRHTLYWLNYSDQEMIMLSYYLALTLEDNPAYQKIYVAGMNDQWQTVQYTENPFWYYIYQLAHPTDSTLQDAYGNSILETAAWSLSRYPTDSIQYQAYIKGARADVLDDNSLTITPKKIIGVRTSTSDARNANNPLNKQLYPDYNAMNIYALIVLPPDERSLQKFNSANFQDADGYNSPTYMEPATMYILPYWFGRYYGMLTEPTEDNNR